jgi:hypothetical protein
MFYNNTGSPSALSPRLCLFLQHTTITKQYEAPKTSEKRESLRKKDSKNRDQIFRYNSIRRVFFAYLPSV